MVPLCVIPQDHESTSISPLCLSSNDSPLMSPIFAKISDAITKLLSCRASQAPAVVTLTGLCRWQLRYQPQRNGQSFELVMWAKEKLRRVVAGVAFDLFHLHFGGGQGFLRFGGFCGVRRIAVDIIHDPFLQPDLHILPLLEGADLVAHDALQVMGEAT